MPTNDADPAALQTAAQTAQLLVKSPLGIVYNWAMHENTQK